MVVCAWGVEGWIGEISMANSAEENQAAKNLAYNREEFNLCSESAKNIVTCRKKHAQWYRQGRVGTFGAQHTMAFELDVLCFLE